jgi:hypothetical protein
MVVSLGNAVFNTQYGPSTILERTSMDDGYFVQFNVGEP